MAVVTVIAAPLFTLAACQPTTKVVPEKTEVTRAWTPEWYSETPRGEEGSIYKTAQAVGANQTVSENLAVNQARQEMALSIDARVDVLQRNFQEQIEAADDLDLLQRFQDVNTIVAPGTGCRSSAETTLPTTSRGELVVTSLGVGGWASIGTRHRRRVARGSFSSRITSDDVQAPRTVNSPSLFVWATDGHAENSDGGT